MFLFGHVGITIGIVKAGQTFVTGSPPHYPEVTAATQSNDDRTATGLPLNSVRARIRSIDYRLVLLGSLLPDIIDKPMWVLTGNSLHWSGRGYAHTFLFSLVILLAGLILTVRQKKTWLLVVSTCSFIHLAFDKMWLDPTTLWWPLDGPIQPGENAEWVGTLWHALIYSPYSYISEILGIVIVSYLVRWLLFHHRVAHFIKAGYLD